MGMDRIAQRLQEGGPPLRVSELAAIIGYSARGVQKLMEAGAVRFVQVHKDAERRIPVTEAVRLARDLGLLTE
jgi:hypothetical protein